VRPIKRAADALGISRKHFYDVLAGFRERLGMAALALAEESAVERTLMEEARK
jgi:hypothetical protein